MTQLFTKEQVIAMLTQQKVNCNIAAHGSEPLDILKAKLPEFPVPAYIVSESIVKHNEEKL